MRGKFALKDEVKLRMGVLWFGFLVKAAGFGTFGIGIQGGAPALQIRASLTGLSLLHILRLA